MTGKVLIRIDEQDDAKTQATEATLSAPTLTSRRNRIVEVDTNKIREGVRALTREVAEFLSDVQRVGLFELHEIQMAVEISASGGVNLVGSLTAEAKGAITLTFKPAPKEENG